MKYIAGLLMMGGNITWQDLSQSGLYGGKEVGIQVTFPLYSRYSRREAVRTISSALKSNQVSWLRWEKPNWLFNSEEFKNAFPNFENEHWLTGKLVLTPEIENKRKIVFDKEREETIVRFIVTLEEIEDQMPKRIFLSHKGTDKEMVRRFKKGFDTLNYAPWLDEDDMHAGVELERGLLQGFSDSCAAVFFITPNYVDEGYLATEINYAIQEKRSKGDRFSIITLVFSDQNGTQGEVPGLLRQYVWKEPKTEIEAFTEVVRALPIKSPPPIWKQGA
nr:toll/interleukin-1 receptor domain-containing protein [uncultured Pseudomonas sp.]